MRTSLSFKSHWMIVIRCFLLIILLSSLPGISVYAVSFENIQKNTILEPSNIGISKPKRVINWSGTGNNLLWSNPENWEGGFVPGQDDAARFSSADLKAIIDSAFTGVLASLVLESGYNGTISLDRDLVVSGDINLKSGTIEQNHYTITSMSWSQSGGTFQGGNAPVLIEGAAMVSGGVFITPSVQMRVFSLSILSPGIVRLGVNGKLNLAGDGEPLSGNGLLDTLTNRPNTVEYTGHASNDLITAGPAVGFRVTDLAISQSRTTDPQDFSQYGTSLVLKSGGNDIYSSVHDPVNGFAYFGTDEFPGVILKVNLQTNTYIGAITLGTNEGLLHPAVIDNLHGFAYFVAAPSPGRLIKIDVNPEHPFAPVETMGFNEEDGYPRSAVIDETRGLAYFGTASKPGHIVKVDIDPSHPLKRIASTVLNSGENWLQSAIIDRENQLAYFGTYDEYPGMIIKIDLETFSRVEALVLNLDDSGFLALIDREKGLAYYGTSNYLGNAIIRIDINPDHPFARLDSLSLSDEYYFLISGVLDPLNQFAYFATEDYPTRILKVDIDPTHSLALLDEIELNSDETQCFTALIDPPLGLAYFTTYREPGKLVRVDINPAHPFARLDALAFPGGENRINSGVIDPEYHAAFFGLTASPGLIVKIDLNSFTRVGVLTLPDGEEYVSHAVIDPEHHLAYFGGGFSQPFVARINTSTFTWMEAVQLQEDEGSYASAADFQNGYLYIGTADTPAKIVKIDIDPQRTFTRIGAIQLNKGEEAIVSGLVDSANGFAYFGTETSPGFVIKVNLAIFSRVTSLKMPGNGFFYTAMIDPANGFAYFGSNLSPGNLVKLDVNPAHSFVSVASLNVGMGCTGVIDLVHHFAYLGRDTMPGEMIKVDIDPGHPFIETGRLTLGFSETNFAGAIIDSQAEFAYFGTDGYPASIIKIHIGDEIFTNLFLPLVVMNK